MLDVYLLIWVALRKKGLKGNFDQAFYFSIFRMNVILRVISEILSRKAVTISFLCSHKHSVFTAATFAGIVTSWHSRKDMQNLTALILYMNFIYIAL